MLNVDGLPCEVILSYFLPNANSTSFNTPCLLVSLQGFVGLRCYRSTKRAKVACWFARTALSPWYEKSDRRRTARTSARMSRKTSPAGQSASAFSAKTWPPSPPLPLCRHGIYTFRSFFVCSSPGCSPFVFSCRAFNFQRHTRKCYLLPFDRFTRGVQKQADVNFTLYEKKGKRGGVWRRFGLFFSREHGERTDFYAGRLCVADCRLFSPRRLVDTIKTWLFSHA